jgi:intermediate cleaving peptidase 55
MVITIEPGIYVPPDSSFPKEFHNIGIRIEVRDAQLCSADHLCLRFFQDEVLVQNDHAVILSVNAPKEVCPFCCSPVL